MFQSFEVRSAAGAGSARVTALRRLFDELGIDAVLVPRADEYQGENVPPSAERLAWLTGFTGSAGVALVLRESAVVFVDGRYTTQLARQVDGNVFAPGDLVGEPPHRWLTRHAPSGLRLGVDPWLHVPAGLRRLEAALSEIGGRLVRLQTNPVDAIWSDRPQAPASPVTIQRLEHSGRLASEKLAELAAATAAQGAAATLVTDPSSLSWLFNIRAGDVPHTPHVLARAIVPAHGMAEIFIEAERLGIEEDAYLTQFSKRHDPGLFLPRLAEIAAGGARILIDPDQAPAALADAIASAGGEMLEAADPSALPRACKNDTEIAGAEAAHVQDGVAMVEFLHWLDSREPGSITEIDAVTALETARRRTGERLGNPLKDISFETIAGAGENAAIIHYRVTSDSNRRLEPGEVFLIDSGGQYVNGTTDITRTVAVGAVDAEVRRFFTLVLKGMIAITTARFPHGTRGSDLDVLARIALWKAGADYAHGTGHGVGAYLSVHEGPQRISRLATQELLPGMILSNEPGYYLPDHYGIRIENLLHVRAAQAVEGGAGQPMLSFATLTLCPIDLRLVVAELLTGEERQWLNDYHASVRRRLQPLIADAAVSDWLTAATRPLD